MAMAATLGLTGIALADVVVEGPGVRARGDWNWSVGGYSMTSIMLGVRDLSCDGRAVGVRLKIYHYGGPTELTRMREYHGGCGNAYTWTGLHWSANFQIQGARVVGCVLGGSCYESEYHDNPRIG